MSAEKKLLIRRVWSGKVADGEAAATEGSELARNVLQEAFNLWVGPEIERRKQAGRIPATFVLNGAQVILNLDADAPEIRLNEEVRATARIKANRAFQRGESVKASEVEEIYSILLTNLDPNAAHVTMVRIRNFWFVAFDFRYNSARANEAHAAAGEFLGCAESALDKGHARAFVENLFSAMELMAKADLLMFPDPEKVILKARSHGTISAKYNWLRQRGGIEPEYTTLLNQLTDLRPLARYLRGTVSLTPERMTQMLTSARELSNRLRSRIPACFLGSKSAKTIERPAT